MAQINANITPPIVNAAQPEAQQDGLIEQPRGALAQGVDGPRIGHRDRPLTFQGLFSDPTRDPCQGDYGRIMRRFGAEGANIIDGMALFRQAALNPRPVLQAYLACVATVRGPRIYSAVQGGRHQRINTINRVRM